MTKFYTGTAVSRDLPADERSFDALVYQSGKPVLDAELNLAQDIRQEAARTVMLAEVPSGFFLGGPQRDTFNDYVFPDVSGPNWAENTFLMRKMVANVAGFPVTVEYTGIDRAGLNAITLQDPPVLGGSPPDVKRTDFVFLEVWRTLVASSPTAFGRVEIIDTDGLGTTTISDGDTITLGAVTFTARVSPGSSTEFAIGPSASATALSLHGTILAEGTFAASLSGSLVTVYASSPGAAGNTTAIAYTEATTGSVEINGGVPSPSTFSGGVDRGHKPSQSTLYRHGNVESPASVALQDDLEDPTLRRESTQRVQIQYRIRTTGTSEAVNYKMQPDGFSNTSVLAQGTQASPVAGYPFVPADGETSTSSSDASSYRKVDSGLWIAGDGSSAAAAALGTLDGFVYAIPICFVFRRNDAYNGGLGTGFHPRTNTNGAATVTHAAWTGNALVGLVPTNASDRPDGLFADSIAAVDVLDLRRHVRSHVDVQAELTHQIQSLLDGSMRTWAIDMADKSELGSGSGSVSVHPLVCNEIGRGTSVGGNDSTSGDTQHGVHIRNFDHIARRFSDAPVVERVVFEVLPGSTMGGNPGLYVTQVNPGHSGWFEGDEIHIDFDALNASTLADWTSPSLAVGASPTTFWPSGTLVTDVLRVVHDDGHYTTAVDQSVQLATVVGLGSTEVVLTLDANETQVNQGDSGNPDTDLTAPTGGGDTGSPRRIFVELEVTYPIGSGTTDTPDFEVSGDDSVWEYGPLLENDVTQRSPEMERPSNPQFRSGYREVSVEQFSNEGTATQPVGTTTTETVVSTNTLSLALGRRFSGHPDLLSGLTVTDAVASAAASVSSTSEFGSSTRKVHLDGPLSGSGQTLCEVTYFAQDPVPNYGASGGGYQVSVYYRTVAPQTAGSKEGDVDVISGGGVLPNSLTVRPLAISTQVYSCITGKGSTDLPFPYSSPMDQLPINDGGSDYAVYTATTPFPGEWIFAATSNISISDFGAATGMLTLNSMVQMDASNEITLGGSGGSGYPYTDYEFRAMYDFAEFQGYRPTIMAQPLSGAVRHKVWFPFLAKSMEDTALFRRGEILLVVLTRYAELDADNTIRFTDVDSRTAVSVYRTKNLLLTVGD